MTQDKYLLDTCTISYFLRLDPEVIEKLEKISPSDIYISVITILEIEYGFSLHDGKRLRDLHEKWQDFLQLVTILNFNSRTALIASEIKKYLKQQGKIIGAYDILIAATALEHDLICVTSNVSEFFRVKNLNTQDWKDCDNR